MDEIATKKVQKVQMMRKPGINVFIKYYEAVSFAKALEKANAGKHVIVSNKRHDEALRSKEFEKFKEAYPCWTGTMTACEGPGEKFNEEIFYVDFYTKQMYVFPVPKKYRGEKDAILVVEHPDFNLVKDGIAMVVVAKDEKVDLVPNFPIDDGWYATDEKHGIPVGNKISIDNPKARYLFRGNMRVGPVVRNSNYRNVIDLCKALENNFGVIVEEVSSSE